MTKMINHLHSDANTCLPADAGLAAGAEGFTRRGAMQILAGSGLAVMSGLTLAGGSAEAASSSAGDAPADDPQSITALVFDAYGTLFDVYAPVFDTAKSIYGPAYNDLFYQTLIQLWRLKQLEYSWLRTLIGEYQDFYACTLSALDFALRGVGIDPAAEPAKRDQLAARYLTLDAYPEALAVLTELKARGLKLAILSNGSRFMLDEVVRANHMENVLDKWISVDEVRAFKPDPRVYALAGPQLGISRKQILFVSSNSFDVLGAKSYGLSTVWIQRSRTAPQVPTPTPAAVAPSTMFGILRGRQEFREETPLLPDYVIPESPTSPVGLAGLLSLAPLQV